MSLAGLALDAELVEPVLEGAEGEAEELGRAGDVPARLLHGLNDERALQLLEADARGRELEREVRRRLVRLADLEREVFDLDPVRLREQDRALDRGLELANVAGPAVLHDELSRLARQAADL